MSAVRACTRASVQGCGRAGAGAQPPAPRPCGPGSPALLVPPGRLRPSASHGRHDAARRAYARTSTCSPSRRPLSGVAMPLGALRCSAPASRATACPPTALPATRSCLSWKPTRVAARWVVPGGGDLWGGEKASPDTGSPMDCPCLASGRALGPGAACKASIGVGARAARASWTDSPHLVERSERSERSELCGATPMRASRRSRSAAQTATP